MNVVNLSREAAPIGDCLLWACLEFGLGLNSTTRHGWVCFHPDVWCGSVGISILTFYAGTSNKEI